MADAKRTCSTPECERPVRARGLCGAHYQAAVKNGALPESWVGNRADINRVKVTCPCGCEMQLTERKAERKRYCSKACFYRYKTRPSGLTYNIVVENRAWFEPGSTPWNAGMVGAQEPWNKGMRFPGQTNCSSFTPGQTAGEKNARWAGDDVGYSGLHQWVRKTLTKTGRCEHCGSTDKPTEWSNVSFEYRRVEGDWQELCRRCHFHYDYENGWGIATAKFNLRSRGAQAR